MYEKSSRNYPKNKEKLVPSKRDFKKMLKITLLRGAEQCSKNEKALGSSRISLRTKSNLLETLVTNRLPKIFLIFSKTEFIATASPQIFQCIIC